MKELVCRIATDNDLDNIVRIHQASFEGFFLTTLGKSFLKQYYKSVLKSADGVLIIVQVEGTIIGFCAGTLLSAGYNMRLIKCDLFGFFCQGIKLLFTHPLKLLHLFMNMTKKNAEMGDKGEYAEILSIGVDPNFQGGGVGKRMLTVLEKEVIVRGGNKLSLTTDFADNEKVVGFYHALGYNEWYDFVTYPNRRMYRMIKRLDNS